MDEITASRLNETIRICFGGKDYGNMSDMFGAPGEALVAREKFFGQFPNKHIVLTDTEGEDRIANLDDTTFTSSPQWVKADGLLTSRRDLALIVFVADCLPILLYAPDRPALALIHVGTSGAAKHLSAQAVAALHDTYDARPEDVFIQIGPSIKKDSYAFEEYPEKKQLDGSWKQFVFEQSGKWHIDLLGYVIKELKDSDIPLANIKIEPIDTGSDTDYFSHRRSAATGEPEGRNAFGVSLI